MAISAFFRPRTRKADPAGERDGDEPKAPRVLFLDDDPKRARIFLEENPAAFWVQTAAECVAALAQAQGWDQVHLDHDLGGELFVDMARADCGMEVVRWLTREPRPRLKAAQFFIHSHNACAATTMGIQLMAAGYNADLRPFGAPPLPPIPEDDWIDDLPPPPRRSLARRLRELFRRPPDPHHLDEPPPYPSIGDRG